MENIKQEVIQVMEARLPEVIYSLNKSREEVLADLFKYCRITDTDTVEDVKSKMESSLNRAMGTINTELKELVGITNLKPLTEAISVVTALTSINDASHYMAKCSGGEAVKIEYKDTLRWKIK